MTRSEPRPRTPRRPGNAPAVAAFRAPRRAPVAAALVALTATLAPAGHASAQHAHAVLRRTLDRGPHGVLPEDRGAAGLAQRLAALSTTASVLYTTGHPDDEEAGVLTLLSRGEGVRTALLTLSRGEGGANAVGPELFDALGLIRGEELRLAGRWYGLDDQYFTTAADYGFSKTLDEAMRSWNREAVLADMVRIIRTNRPLVVISRWHGSERDGHGHHQAAGVLTPEAVRAAADPARFPEQIAREGLRPWRVRKVYRGRIRSDEPWHLAIDPFRTSPWLGTTYQDFGSRGLSLQRSQTSGRVRAIAGRGPPALYERLEPPGAGLETSLFAGLDVTLPGIFDLVGEAGPEGAVEALRRAAREVAAALDGFDAADPDAVAPWLASATTALDEALALVPAGTDAAFLIGVERREVEMALAAALGVEVLATARRRGAPAGDDMGPAVPGAGLDVDVAVRLVGNTPLSVDQVRLEGPATWAHAVVPDARTPPMSPGETLVWEVPLDVPPDARPTRPWFHRRSIAENAYAVRDSAEIHAGESRPRVTAVVTVRYEGVRVEAQAPVETVVSRAPYGSERHALAIAPALSVRTAPRAAVVLPGRASVPVTVEVVSNATEAVDAVVDLALPAGWSSSPAEEAVRFEGPGEVRSVTFDVTPSDGFTAGGPEAPAGAGAGDGPGPATPRGAVTLRARARSGDRAYGEGYRVIEHRDLARRYLYEDATVDVVPVDARLAAGLSVGYVMGVGDEVPDAIAQLIGGVSLLGEFDLASGDLATFDAIVVGTRAYAVRRDLVAHNGRLLAYARSGGHLVVLYQTPEYDPGTQAPFPATLPGNAEEVSEQDAPVAILAPDHPLLTQPNRIGPTDFEGWIEQRGSKFFATWSDDYTPLIETHDTGQAPQEGVWLTAEVGAGRFTYASIALHRQLPYGVPGAYRILANLLSAGR